MTAVRLLTPAETAAMLRVDPKTVVRWANAGKLPCVRTLGGHRRFREDDVLAIVHGTAACTACGYALGAPGHRVQCLKAAS